MQTLTILIALVFTLCGAPVSAQAPGMSYSPALSWSGSLRLTALTGEPQWQD